MDCIYCIYDKVLVPTSSYLGLWSSGWPATGRERARESGGWEARARCWGDRLDMVGMVAIVGIVVYL